MKFHNNSIAFNISREMALDWGLVEPTPEESARRDAAMAEWRARRAAANAALPEALAALDGIADQPTRLVLDLHQRVTEEYRSGWTCGGCCFSGYDAEAPEWPCETVATLAEHYDIDLPSPTAIERPEDGSLDAD